MGLPVLRASPLCTCCRHYPGTASGCIFRSLHQTYQPSPHWRTGRPVHRHFRGLLSVHSRYGLHTRWIILNDPLHQRLQPLRYLRDCSDCFRLERNCRVGLSPTGKTPPLHGARHFLTYTDEQFRAGMPQVRTFTYRISYLDCRPRVTAPMTQKTPAVIDMCQRRRRLKACDC